jgi:hypothetical protein
VALVHDQDAEVVLWQVALDELGGPVAALAEAELEVRQCSFHSRGLAVAEHELAVVVHQVQELVDCWRRLKFDPRME